MVGRRGERAFIPSSSQVSKRSWSEGRVPRQPEHPLAHSKLGTAQRAASSYLRHRERFAMFRPLKGEAPGRPSLQLHEGTYWKDPEPVLHPPLGSGAAGLLFSAGASVASAPSGSATSPSSATPPSPPCSAYSPGWRRSGRERAQEEMTRSWREKERREGKKKRKGEAEG